MTHLIAEEKQVIRTDFGAYQLYKGFVWLSVQDVTKKIEGVNIAIRNDATGDLRIVAYVMRKGDRWAYRHQQNMLLSEVVEAVLDSLGWKKEWIRRLLD